MMGILRAFFSMQLSKHKWGRLVESSATAKVRVPQTQVVVQVALVPGMVKVLAAGVLAALMLELAVQVEPLEALVLLALMAPFQMAPLVLLLVTQLQAVALLH
ncbi:MAG: hypothetical protein CMQ07_00430 [Gammaproteobacteria bacterium]|nr:hypothetical protein [Gammaproteobacteria bacterium]